MRGQNVLFSSARQGVYELNDTAADIWACLAEGWPPAEISSAIADRGVGKHQASALVSAAIRNWERLGLVWPKSSPATPEASGRMIQTIAVGGIRIRINYPPACAELASGVFRHLAIPGPGAEVTLEAVESGSTIHILRDGEWAVAGARREFVTLLKGQLVGAVLERANYELALHAATLVSQNRAMLLVGVPGAGKTTLTLGLVDAGLGFGGDDVAILDPEGSCLGLPFAPAVKAGAWRLLEGMFPALASGPVFHRPDGKRVRYLAPGGFRPSAACGIGWIILLDRRRSAGTKLVPIDPVGAMQGLLHGSLSAHGALTGSAFEVLMRVLDGAESYRLVYSDLGAAVQLLAALCADASC